MKCNEVSVDYDNETVFPRDYTDFPKTNPQKGAIELSLINDTDENEISRSNEFIDQFFKE